MPATNDEWPNWRLALPEPIETLKTNRLAARIARALGEEAEADAETRAVTTSVVEPSVGHVGAAAAPRPGRSSPRSSS